jgi:methionyl-tRNA formyltransferase
MTRIAFLGQGPLGEACFSELLRSQAGVVVAVSNSNDTNWWKSNAIFKACVDESIEFIDNSSRNDAALVAAIKHHDVDTIISVQHSWIVSEEALNLVSGNAFNLHMAKLPEYKGHHPFIHVLLNGETSHTVTLHRMTPRVDVGDIAYELTFPITPEDTAHSLYYHSLEIGKTLFQQFVLDLTSNITIPARAMDGSHRFYSRKSINGLDLITDPYDFIELDKKARAFFFPPFPSAFLELNGKKYHVLPAVTGREELRALESDGFLGKS